MALFRRVKPPFSLKTLQKDSNCIAIQDPSQVWGVQDFLPRRNLLLATDTLATQNVTVVATTYNLYMQGTGSITLSGMGSGTLNGTGANNRVSLSFTPTAGTLTLTVSGTVTYGMLTRADTIDQSYQKITDWTTEQYAWAAAKQVPWLRRNIVASSNTFAVDAGWATQNATISAGTSSPPAGYSACVTMTGNASVAIHRVSTDQTVIYNQYLSGTNYCYEFVAKAGTATCVQLFFNGVAFLPANAVYVNFDLSAGTVGDKHASVTASIDSLGGGWYRCRGSCVASATIIGAGLYLYQIDSASASPLATSAASKTVELTGGQYTIGTFTTHQPVGASWGATYTANAIAAGYPISLWQDAAGTTAVTGDNQPIGKMLDMKGTYTATQSTTANQPKWRLDSNGKPYIERDLTNDSLPITLPTVLSDAQLGPELWDDAKVAVYGESQKLGTQRYRLYSTGALSYFQTIPSVFTVGKTYLFTYTITSIAVSGTYGVTDTVTRTSSLGTQQVLVTYSSGNYIKRVGSIDCVFENVSVREVTGTNVVYTAEGNVTLKDSGLILSGSYAPITPSADYGRIIMAADSRYDAKIIKYLDQKRGRAYSLGPELVTNGAFASGSSGWTTFGGATFSGGACILDAAGIVYQGVVTTGKMYLISYDLASGTAAHKTTAGGTKSIAQTGTGRFNAVVVCGSSSVNAGVENAGASSVTIDNVSVREVLL